MDKSTRPPTHYTYMTGSASFIVIHSKETRFPEQCDSSFWKKYKNDKKNKP